jgi:hypothetical protein
MFDELVISGRMRRSAYLRGLDVDDAVFPKIFLNSSFARSSRDFWVAFSCLPARLMWKLSIDIAD